MSELFNIQRLVLETLANKPLSEPDLMEAIASYTDKEIKVALYHLQRDYLITKALVINGGCKGCACQTSYRWCLTTGGRRAITHTISSKEKP